MNEQKWFVYKHTNLTNSKVYIGITHDIHKRWRGSGCAYKSNRHFWQAIQRYGWDGFSHEILNEDISHQEACAIEIELIKKYRSCDRQYGYNNSPGGDSPLVIHCGKEHHFYGKHFSEEHRKKLSEAHKGANHYCFGKHLPEATRMKIGNAHRGRPLSENQKEQLRKANLGRKASQETREKMSLAQKGRVRAPDIGKKISDAKAKRQVVQLSKSGEVIQVWPSVSLAARENKISSGQICKCCKGSLNSSGGFIWIYADTVKEQQLVPISQEKRDELLCSGRSINNPRGKKEVMQLSKSGDIIKMWPSLTQAACETHILVSSISQCCNGKIRSSGGFVWKFVDNDDK